LFNEIRSIINKNDTIMTAVEFNHQLTSLEEALERFAMSLTANREDAKDLVQETYLKALSYREKFMSNTNLKAWVYTIMKNSFINNYRRAVRENTTFDNTKDLYYLNGSGAGYESNPESVLSAGEIQSHIDKLDDDLRIPFQMHQDGFKYKEIAEELDLKIGTVKSRIFFGRKKLMESVEN
jgi:RNA polymerase sigma-70 factor (ECF subfamily)